MGKYFYLMFCFSCAVCLFIKLLTLICANQWIWSSCYLFIQIVQQHCPCSRVAHLNNLVSNWKKSEIFSRCTCFAFHCKYVINIKKLDGYCKTMILCSWTSTKVMLLMLVLMTYVMKCTHVNVPSAVWNNDIKGVLNLKILTF